jgi:amino acid adenylation domain-containing protein
MAAINDDSPSQIAQRIAALPLAKRQALRSLLESRRGRTGRARIPRRSESASVPLSFGQERLWVMHHFAPSNPLHHLLVDIVFEGLVDTRIIQRSFQEVVHRHEVLRTTFQLTAGKVVQTIGPPMAVNLPTRDLSHLPEPEQRREIVRFIAQELRTPFDLRYGPLHRATILRLGPSKLRLTVVLHHLIGDGVSLHLIRNEVEALCSAYVGGRDPQLPALPIQYGDYCVWQRESLLNNEFEADVAYWRTQLAELPLLQLSGRPRPSVPTFRAGTHDFVVPGQLATGLQALCQRENATLFMGLLSVYAIMLHRYAEATDIAVGCPTAGRTRTELEPLIGFLINWLVLRCDTSGDPSFLEMLRRVRETALEGYMHQDVPFEKLVDELDPRRDISRNPLFQVMLQLLHGDQTLADRAVSGRAGLRGANDQGAAAVLDLALTLWEQPERIVARFDYSADLFDAEEIGRMAEHFCVLLERLLADPEAPVGSVPLLSSAEHSRLLTEWNATTHEFPDDTCIHHLVEAQARRSPSAVALAFDGEQRSYDWLNGRANQLASQLRTMGVGPGQFIGVCMERSTDMIVAILGVLKAGAAFLPLDPAYPAGRLRFMVQDSGAGVVLGHASSRERLHQLQVASEDRPQVLLLDAHAETLAGYSTDDPAPLAGPRDVAYLIYTSGSTGQPKGVPVEHRALCNLAVAQSRILEVRPGSRFLQFSSLSFDASVSEIFVTLCAGATLCMATREELMPGPPLAKLLREQDITVATLAPSVLAATPEDHLPALATISVAGEPCSLELVRRWAPGRTFLNLYGPTETTVCATSAELSAADELVTIGRPITNMKVHVVNDHLVPAPVGVPGEIVIGGVGVARGYLHRPELTASKFVPSPFDRDGGMLYRTGDRGRVLSSGEIQFLGRTDRQVKLRGYRIELGEIESALRGHPAVRDAVVVVANARQTSGELVAYVTTREPAEDGGSELRGYLRGRLPAYMVPGTVQILDAIPLTPNGKVDQRSLPMPAGVEPNGPYLRPRTELEKLVAFAWRRVLGVDQVSSDANFFDLGGHSFTLVQVQTQLQDALRAEIPLIELFRQPTVRDLAEFLGTHLSSPTP